MQLSAILAAGILRLKNLLPASSPKAGRDHLPALTGLRFVLAVWVILHHLTGKGRMLDPLVRSLPEAAQGLFSSGYLAVGTFFVLSGFVLSRSYAACPWDKPGLIRYAVGRAARVYPVYLFSLLLIAPIIWADLLSAKTGDLGEKAALVTSYSLVLQGWELPRVHWNTPAWSLSCEFFFYLTFPVLAVVSRRATLRRSLIFAGAGLALPWLLRQTPVPAAWKPLLHVGDFLLGVAASGLYDAALRWDERTGRRGYWLYAPAMVLAAAVIAAPPLVWRFLTLNDAMRPLNTSLVIGLALGGGLPAAMLSARVVVYLGKASYAMYILHIPMLWWFKRSGMYKSGALSPAAAALLYLAAVLAVSALVYRVVEEPANRSLRRWLTPRERTPRREDLEAARA